MTRETIASDFSGLFQGRLLRTQPLHVGLIPVISAVLTRIGFHDAAEHWCGDDGDVPVSKVLEVLVQGRLASSRTVPLSRIHEWVRDTTLPLDLGVAAPKLNDSRLGRVLEVVGRNADNLWMEVVAGAGRVYNLEFLFSVYDVTSVYFEGEHSGSDLIKYGYNRDGKPGTKQINVGFTVEGNNGIPMFYTTIAGNVNDSATVEANMEKLSRFLKMVGQEGKGVVVGDRAMLTPAQMVRYKETLNLDFIGCMQNGALQHRLIQDTPDELLMLSPLPYVAKRLEGSPARDLEDEKYYACRVPARVVVPEPADAGDDAVPESADRTPNGKRGRKKDRTAPRTILVWALVVLACGKRRLDAQKREDQLLKTEARLAAIQTMLNSGKYKKLAYARSQVEAAIDKHLGSRRLLNAVVLQDPATSLLSLTWSRNTQAIQKQAFHDGKYVVFFSDGSSTNAEVFQKFKRRDVVERRIATFKGPVPVRPIYLHDDTRIRGLIFVTMVALLVASLIERQLCSASIDATIETIQRLFSRFGGTLLTFEDHSQAVTLPTPGKWQGQLLAALGVDLPQVVPVQIPELYQEGTALDPCPWPTHPYLNDSETQ